MAMQFGMSRSEWEDASRNNPQLLRQMIQLADTMSDYSAAQTAWLDLGGFEQTIGLSPAAGPGGLFLDTPASYLTGRTPSRHFGRSIAGTGLGFLSMDELGGHEGPVYIADFGEAVHVWGDIPAEWTDPWVFWSADPVDFANGEGGSTWDPEELRTVPEPHPLLRITPDRALPNAVTTAPVDTVDFLISTYDAMTSPAPAPLEYKQKLAEWREAARVVKVAPDQAEALQFWEDYWQELGLLAMDLAFAVDGALRLRSVVRAPDPWGHVRGSPATWNEFQGATAGVYSSRAEAGRAWAAYRDAHGLGVAGTAVLEGEGQVHHLISARIAAALDQHPTLAAHFARNDERLMYRAVDLQSHYGYQSWHRTYDDVLVGWLDSHPFATREEFIDLLDALHVHEDMVARFGVLDLTSLFEVAP
jgi:hypothetical protein